MATKRAGSKTTNGSSTASGSPPWTNAILLAGAIGYGMWLLVNRGRLSWPPRELLAGATTLAGCLALVGPLVLGRKDAAEGGLGDLIWLSGGLLVWVFDLASLARGRWRGSSWATPLDVQFMGMVVLAVALAGWRLRGGSKSWSWTNVTGWLLGAFWIGMAFEKVLNASGGKVPSAE